MIPLIEKEIVVRRGWVTPGEFVDAIALAQAAPGPIAVNAAVFIGYRIKRGIGAILAAVGATLPSLIVIMVIAAFFARVEENELARSAFRGIAPAVVALIAAAAVNLGRKCVTDRFSLVVTLCGIAVLLVLRIHPIAVIVAAGLAGFLMYGRRPKTSVSGSASEGDEVDTIEGTHPGAETE